MEQAFEEIIASFAESLQALGVEAEMRERLARFLDVLWEENQRINLVSRKMDRQTLVVDHLIDSLLGLPFIPADAATIVDLGTGGGFPAIPLALCRPDLQFDLYEKSALKRRYLQGLAGLIPNLSVSGKLEDWGLEDDVDLIISRAFKPIATTLSFTRDFLRGGGSYMLFKARRQRVDAELKDAAGLLKGIDVRVQMIASPLNGAERHLVWIGPNANCDSAG